MFVPRLNDAPVVIGDVGKRQEDRNNEKVWVRFVEKDYNNWCEWWNVNTYS